jgi:hypothetical protein
MLAVTTAKRRPGDADIIIVGHAVIRTIPRSDRHKIIRRLHERVRRLEELLERVEDIE